MTDTVRARLESAIALEGEWPEMVFGEVMDHVQAALKLLDEAERLVKRDGTQNRLVPDPGSSSPDATREEDA